MRKVTRVIFLLTTLISVSAEAMLCRFALHPGDALEFSRTHEGTRAEQIEFLGRRIPIEGRQALRDFVLEKLEKNPNALEDPEHGFIRALQIKYIEGVRRPRLVGEWEQAAYRSMREMAFETVEHRFAESIRRIFEGRPKEREDLLAALASSLQVEVHMPVRSTRMEKRLKQARFTVLSILHKRERELLRSLELDRHVRQALEKNDLSILDNAIRDQMKAQSRVTLTVNAYRWFTKTMTLAIAAALLWELKDLALDEPGIAWEELSELEQLLLPQIVDRLRRTDALRSQELSVALGKASQSKLSAEQAAWVRARAQELRSTGTSAGR